MKYWFRFANACYFESYSKLQIPKLQTSAIFHFSFKYDFFPPKTFSLKSSTTSSSQNFQNLIFQMIPKQVHEGWSIVVFQSGIVLVKCQLRVNRIPHICLHMFLIELIRISPHEPSQHSRTIREQQKILFVFFICQTRVQVNHVVGQKYILKWLRSDVVYPKPWPIQHQLYYFQKF